MAERRRDASWLRLKEIAFGLHTFGVTALNTSIKQAAAKFLQEKWIGRRVVELEGPTRITPTKSDDAISFETVLQELM